MQEQPSTRKAFMFCFVLFKLKCHQELACFLIISNIWLGFRARKRDCRERLLRHLGAFVYTELFSRLQSRLQSV